MDTAGKSVHVCSMLSALLFSDPLFRAAERIIGPWGSFNFGPLAYLSLYILRHVMLHEDLSFVTKGVWGFSPEKKILENGAILCILCTKWQAYHNHIGIDKCSGPPISPGPGEIPPPPPPLWACLSCAD